MSILFNKNILNVAAGFNDLDVAAVFKMKAGTLNMSKILFNKGYVITLVVVMVTLICFSGCGTDSLEGSSAIAEGVSVCSVDVGGMTVEEATAALQKKVSSLGEVVLNFECEGTKFSVSSEELSLKFDSKKTAERAYKVGRGEDKENNKKVVAEAKDKGYSVNPVFFFDESKLLLTANDYCADKISDPSPMNVEIGEDCLIIRNAMSGMVVNMDKAKASIEAELSDLKSDKSIKLYIEEVTPENLTFDEFKKEYLRDAKDAVYTKNGDNHNIEPEVIGIKFDEAEAKKIFDANKDSKDAYTIPAEITRPEITAKALEDKYVNNILASYTTSFAGSSQGRCTNIKLACEKIDGYVLNPGDRFSYNRVVGPRTAAAGFKMAHVYVGNQVVDGIGGGICQVSSTLYNAQVLADLKTVSRRNHSMPVSYVPLGRDATVSYGSIDYVFENNKSYPVSIRCSISGTSLTISIVGSEPMDYTVEFVSSYNSTVPFSTVKVDDPQLAQGEEKVITAGSNGSLYDSYRVYKKNGVEYDRKYEAKSRYQPTAQKIAVGTMVVDSEVTDKPADEETDLKTDDVTDVENPESEEKIADDENIEEEEKGIDNAADETVEEGFDSDVRKSEDTAEEQ